MSLVAVQNCEQGSSVSDAEKVSGRLLPETEPTGAEAPSSQPEGCEGPHNLDSRHGNRKQFAGTFFFRNRPALELMRHEPHACS
jgi:hypothetical protein